MDTGQTSLFSPTRGWRRIVFGRNPGRTLLRIGFLVASVFLLYHYVIFPIRVSGISMEPNFHDRQLRYVWRLAFRTSLPQRGDAVSIKLVGNRLLLIKRIIGLPGETVDIKRGIVFVNGRALEEPYVKLRRAPWDYSGEPLQAGEYFVVGDNRSMDRDDHYFGRVQRARILGKVVF